VGAWECQRGNLRPLHEPHAHCGSLAGYAVDAESGPDAEDPSARRLSTSSYHLNAFKLFLVDRIKKYRTAGPFCVLRSVQIVQYAREAENLH